MLLGEVDAEQLLDDRAETDAGEPGQPGAELGVEDRLRVEPDLAQAGEVLARRVQDPLLVRHRLAERGEVVEPVGGSAGGSKRKVPALAPEHLDQVGALRVPEAGGAFGVDRDRPGAGGDARHRDPRRRAPCVMTSRASRWSRFSHAPLGDWAGGVPRPTAGGRPASMQSRSLQAST